MVSIAVLHLYFYLVADGGFESLSIFYLSVFVQQMVYYVLLTHNGFWITLGAFLLNYILWIAEQVNLEATFTQSTFYIEDRWTYGVVVLGGVLWATNKLIIDWAFAKLKVRFRPRSLAERIMKVR